MDTASREYTPPNHALRVLVRIDTRQGLACLEVRGCLTTSTYGTLVNEALAAAEKLAEAGVAAEVVKLGIIRPLDTKNILASVRKTGALLVAEECCESGCVGEKIAAAIALSGENAKLKLLNLGAGIVPQGDVSELRALKKLEDREFWIHLVTKREVMAWIGVAYFAFLIALGLWMNDG